MAKIKIKDIEGDDKALTDLFASSDCSLAEYLNVKPVKEYPLTALIIVISLFSVCSCLLFIGLFESQSAIERVFIILEFLLLGFSILSVHLYWKNTGATIITTIVSLCIMAVSLGIWTPEEAFEKMENQVEQQINK